jgi:1-acyl-sn-glycerol-3-phosphate acyltransferase
VAPPAHLPRCNALARFVGKALALLTGWRFEGQIPEVNKAVLIASPHTSNWDIFHSLLAGWSKGISFHWLVKADHLRGPGGWLVRALNGVAVDRSAPQGLVVPASGTRSYRPYWKSGFYWMASEARVPIILGYLDYARKRAGFGPLLRPTDDIHSDMDAIRTFYDGVQGKFPDKVSRIRLRAEDEGDDQE